MTAFGARVLIHLSPADGHARLIDAAAEIGAALGARLEGLYVEEAGALEASGLPFAAVLARGGEADADQAALRAALTREAEVCGRLLARTAAARRLESGFRVAEGVPEALLAAESRVGDLLALGAAGAGESWSARAARAARMAPMGGGALLMGRAVGGAVLAFGPGGASARVRAVAERVGRALHARVRATAAPTPARLIVAEADAAALLLETRAPLLLLGRPEAHDRGA